MIKTLVFVRLCVHDGLKRQVQRQGRSLVQSLGLQRRWQRRLAGRYLSRLQRAQRSICLQANGEDAAKKMNGGSNTSLVTVDRSLVEYTAQLANLQYTSDELEALVPAFQEMLRFVETLQGLEDSNDQDVGAAMWTPTGERSVHDLRTDVVDEFPERDAIRDQFPSAERGLLRVPRVIGNDQN